MEHVGRIVIVEPDQVVADVILRECARLRRVSLVRSVDEATGLLQSDLKVTALITEQSLADGKGISILGAYRDVYSLLPMLMLTADTTPSVINRAHLLRAEFIAKPAHRRNLRAFLRWAVAFERIPDRRIAFAIDNMVRARALSPRETDVLAAAVQGLSRKIIADQIGTTDNTIKSCVRGLLRKCDATSLNEVVRAILLEALEGAGAQSDDPIDRESAPPGSPFTIPPPEPN